jgi:uncharacterized protein (DUF1330 family)
MPAFQDTPALVRKLVEIHGEQGICPTARDWTQVLNSARDQPLTILNLLQFKPTVEAAGATITGWQAYTAYSTEVGAAFARVGGKLVYFGKVSHMFPDTGGTWDAAVMTRYPTPRALAEFWLDHEFIRAHRLRIDGVERSCIIVLSAASRLG